MPEDHAPFAFPPRTFRDLFQVTYMESCAPMTAIRMLALQVLDDDQAHLTMEQREYITLILHHAENLQTIHQMAHTYFEALKHASHEPR